MRGVLLDGFARATWKTELTRRGARLVIEPFEPLPERDRRAVAKEGARLLAFAAPDADARDVRFAGDR